MALQKDLYRRTEKKLNITKHELQRPRNNTKIILNRLANITALKIWKFDYKGYDKLLQVNTQHIIIKIGHKNSLKNSPIIMYVIHIY
jgi:hypothetical protein